MAATPATIDDFLNAWKSAVDEDRFVSMTLADRLLKGSKAPHKQIVRPKLIQESLKLQWELCEEKRQRHVNLNLDESLQRLRELFGQEYREAYLFSTNEELTIRAAKNGLQLRRKTINRSEMPTVTPHDRVKNYLIPEGIPCRFLEVLGVMTSEGHVRKQKQKKFRQINRYLEIVNDIYPQLPAAGTLRIVDFGCGLSYLTFALHHLLRNIHHREVELLGIDQNPSVIERCQQISQELGLQGVRFQSRKIDPQATSEPLDLAISLHACDTATDHALAFAANAHAKVILAVPCCQHELLSQIHMDALQPMLRHGILKERFSAMATDALRAAALEARGYRTQIMEFIELEHTPKNLLIRAIHENSTGDATQYHTLKADLSIHNTSTDLILASAT